MVFFALWLLAEARSRSPLIDLKVMRLPAVWTTNTAALLFGAGMYSIWSFLPGFVQTPRAAGYGFGASVTASGLLMLPMLVAMFLSGVLTGRLEPVVGAKVLLTAGAAFGVSPAPSSPSGTTSSGRWPSSRACSGSGSDWPSPPWPT